MTDSECMVDQVGAKWWWHRERFELHRLDGPAVEWPSGSRSWFVDNKRHRLDGPAIEDDAGVKQWWVMDKKLTQEEFEQHPLVVFHRLCKEAL